MQTRQQSIDNFTKCIDALIYSSYILSDKKLTDLMRTLSTSKMLYKLIEHCTDDFDFYAQYEKSFVSGETFGKGTYVPPTDARATIAFVFGLLYQINTNQIELLPLLDKYFYAGENTDRFRNFTMQVLVPFRTEILHATKAMMEEQFYVEPKEAEVQVKPAAENQKRSYVLTKKDARQISTYLDETRAIILQYKIDVKQKTELVDVYTAFRATLFGDNAKLIKSAYLAYKYITLYYRKNDNNISRVEQILKNASIID